MCDILRHGRDVQNLLIMKIHGGTTKDNIYAVVKKAVVQAERNRRLGVRQTVLFFDEANTTNAIGAIKEIMCDRLVDGVPIPGNIGLQFVAAVNPYRVHSDEMIKKLENAGLGYHIKVEKTVDRCGKIPMRRLVYRVKEIPASLFPLIWDFGNLDDHTEKKYITQMLSKRNSQNATQVSMSIYLLFVNDIGPNFECLS
jgi:E3 ubiquitin-protein ligase RNF213